MIAKQKRYYNRTLRVLKKNLKEMVMVHSWIHRAVDPQIFISLPLQIHGSSGLHIQIYVSSNLYSCASMDLQIPNICRSSDPRVPTSMDPLTLSCLHPKILRSQYLYIGSTDLWIFRSLNLWIFISLHPWMLGSSYHIFIHWQILVYLHP